MNVVDITPIFSDLIENIICLEYKELSKTPCMQELCEYVHDHNEFMVNFGDEMMYFENVDELFFGTMEYFKKQERYKEMEWIQRAINKMETFIMVDNVSDMMQFFNL